MRWGSLSWLTELIKGRAGTELPSGQEGLWRGCAPSQITMNNHSGQECPRHKPNLTQRTGAQEVTGGSACWAELAPQGAQAFTEVIRDICKLMEDLHHRTSQGNPNNLS